MEEDDDLTRLLARAADPPVATPEVFREVMVRYRKGRTRALLAALAVVALLGPAAGVAVGRATSHRPVQVATGGSPTSGGTRGSASGSAGAGSGGAAASRSDTASSSSGSVATPASFPVPSPPRKLFLRTTADGVTIRAYLQESLAGYAEDKCAADQSSIPCPKPPPECAPPSTQLQAGLSDDGAIEPGWVPVNTTDTPGSLQVLQSSYFGVVEGDPAAWVAVKADAGIARVRVRYADGATDEMVPVDGYAVLAHRMAAPAAPTDMGPASSPEEAKAQMQAHLPQGSAEALDASGAVVSTADLASVTGPFSPQCMIAGEPPMPPVPAGEVLPPEAATATTVAVPGPVPSSAPATTRP